MSYQGCLPVVNHRLFKAGIEITDDCFIYGDYVYYRRLDTILSVTPNVVSSPPSPSIEEHTTNSFFTYNITKRQSSRISSIVFYETLRCYKKAKLTSKDLNDLLNKALEDFFVQYVWLKSLHNQVINYEVNPKEGGNRDS
jgi:hypothetical protein